MRCQGLTGLVSMPLNIRPRIKMALGPELDSVGLAGDGMAVGCQTGHGQHMFAGVHLHLHIAGRVAVGPMALLCQAMWRSPALCLLRSLWSLLPCLSLSACVLGLCCFLSPMAPSLLTLAPQSLSLSPYICLSSSSHKHP